MKDNATPNSPVHSQLAPHLSRKALRQMALSAFLLVPALPLCSSAFAATPATITLAADTDPNTFGTRLAGLIYTEAFKRMGISLKIEFLPMARRTVLADAGEIDGDTGRSAQYGAAHPNLVRVEEPSFTVSFGLFGVNPKLKFKSLEDLRSSDLAVEYKRGVLFCENKLKALQLKHLSDITNEVQALKKLMAGRIDLYCDVDPPVRQTLNTPEFKGQHQVREILDLGTLPVHAYLHNKHSNLAPKLSATLKAMRDEGLLDTYRLKVEHELGMTLLEKN